MKGQSVKLSALLVVAVLFGAVLTLAAAQKQLPIGHVPALVAQGKIASLGRLPGDHQLRLAIGLPLRDTAGLTNLLRDLYDPASPQFHHYLTPQQFTERFGPTSAQYAAVVQFARTNGFSIVGRHPNRLALDVTGRVGDIERAFHVRLHSYRHPQENRNFFAPDAEPWVDASLPVLHVSGLNDYSLPHPQVILSPSVKKNAVPLAGTGPGGNFFGGDFRQAYAPGTPLTGAGQSIGLLQFDGFYPQDITNFANAVGVTNLPPVVVMPVDGGVTNIGGGEVEVALDIEMSLSMAPGISNVYVYEATNGAPWVDILSQMADDDLANQLSSSWSGGGSDPTAAEVFLQMAAQGQSFYNASGDSEAYTGLIPFPCDEPNITIVGGTMLTTDGSGNYQSESAWNRHDGFSGGGGGISVQKLIPSWQLGIDLTAAHGSTSMRNIPDVALVAENVYIYSGNGGQTPVGGTSCAAPLWAGFTALANQQAAQLGQSPVGFINPTIYALNRGTNYALAFHDITTGDNTGYFSPTNFFAVPGFDLCTGWGTPGGTNLINLLTTPDDLGVSPQSIFTSGMVGGPFQQTAWSLVLTNSGVASLDWALGPVPSLLTASTTNGTLLPGSSTNITLQGNALTQLPAGIYTAALLVTNLSLDRIETVSFRFEVGQSLVENGGFETGDFTGWLLIGDLAIGNNIYNLVTTDDEFIGITEVVHSGNFGAFLGQGGHLASLSQSLFTVPGQRYQVSFWLDNPETGTNPQVQQFMANWDGTNLFAITNPPVFAWTNYQFVVTASGTNTVLQFLEENDPDYFGFDDVSVLPVPPVVFAGVSAGTNGPQFNWDSLAGLNYLVQFTTNLVPACWQNLSTITAATNISSLSDTNPVIGVGQRFYRLELLLP
jgi:hypothetical protein